MSQKFRSLYGGAGNFFHYENESSIQGEVSAMHEQTRLMIEEAAYSLAEKRGFNPGHELADWLQAKRNNFVPGHVLLCGLAPKCLLCEKLLPHLI
jgi:hypothetical protein